METKICKQALDIIAEYNSLERKMNIFNIISLKPFDEVRLHTPFIAYLLDVNETHGARDAFQRAFIEVIFGKDYEFNTKSSRVFKELSIGKVTDKEGGRIDILVESDFKAIIIENKLNAKEGENQLERYRNYAEYVYKKEDNSSEILYLTLKNEEPSDANDVKYKHILYENQILNWLYRCIEIATDNFRVREMIRQYKDLIEEITNQSSKKKLLERIKVDPKLKEYLFNHYFVKHFNERLSEINCELEKDKVDNALNNANKHLEVKDFTFYTKPKDSEFPKISFQFVPGRSKDGGGLHYGIQAINVDKKIKKNIETFACFTKNKEGWIYWRHLDKYRWWNGINEDVYLMMTNPNSDLYNYLITITKELFYAAGVKLK